jgi:acetyl esterase/lipase
MRSRLRQRLAGLAVLLAAAGTVACTPAELLGIFVPSNGYAVESGLAYGPGSRQALDIYVPKTAPRPAPVIVFLYGGAWTGGTRAYYRFVGEAFTRLGAVVVVPDYRLYPEVRFPAFVDDGARALRWVRDHIAGYGGDPDRLILVGHSAGAHIAALLALDRRYLAGAGVPQTAIRGVVGLAGPYAADLRAYRTTRPIFATAVNPADTKPVTFAANGKPPMLLLHGADDDIVDSANSLELARRITTAGGTARAVVYPSVGHIGIVLSLAAPLRNRDGIYGEIAAFVGGL